MTKEIKCDHITDKLATRHIYKVSGQSFILCPRCNKALANKISNNDNTSYSLRRTSTGKNKKGLDLSKLF